jgi:hypothetical protein
MVKEFLIWAAATLLCAFSGAAALGSIAKDKSPELAFSLFPKNGFALENLASRPVKLIIAKNGGQFPSDISPSSIKLAKQAFSAEPITPQAMAVLALSGSQNNIRKLMRNALLLTRREQFITSWMIADSAARKDIPAILKYYDTTLRTSSSAAPVVIPVLVNALADDNFITPFANMLTKRPPWASQFWATVLGSPGSLGNAARLREVLYKPNERDNDYRDPDLIMALVNNKQFEQANNLYDLLSGQKKNRQIIVNGDFKNDPIYPPLDWQLFSTGDYGAAIADGNLKLSATQNSGGLFARQLVQIPERANIYVKADISLLNEAEIFISLTCAQTINDGPRIIRIRLNNPVIDREINNSQSRCRFYWFDITGRASQSEMDSNIIQVSISSQ